MNLNTTFVDKFLITDSTNILFIFVAGFMIPPTARHFGDFRAFITLQWNFAMP